jgi:hypothetical protein
VVGYIFALKTRDPLQNMPDIKESHVFKAEKEFSHAGASRRAHLISPVEHT